MKSFVRAALRLSCILAIFLLAACGDDDPAAPPAPTLWEEVPLDLADGDSQLMAVDFTGNYGMAMAAVTSDKAGLVNQFFRPRPDGSWLEDDLMVLPPELFAMDLALDTTGKPVLAGYQMSGPAGVVYDYRGAQPTPIQLASLILLTVDGEGAFMVAGGRSRGGGLSSSPQPDQWFNDDLPLSGNNDSGFRDIDIRNGRAVACGYDDGADTLQVILTRTADTDWEKIPTGGPFNATYLAIALNDDGLIFVGGMAGAGGPSAQAFLSQRTTDGHWFSIPLPDPELLHGVMDILVAADGSLYLACMGEGDQTQANLIHASPTGIFKEITPFPGGLLQVDQAADGSIYAVGFRRNVQDGTTKGVMLVKSP